MTKREDLRLQGDTGSKTGGDQSEKGNKKRAHPDTTRISRMLGTTAFSARTEFSVTTGGRFCVTPASQISESGLSPEDPWAGLLSQATNRVLFEGAVARGRITSLFFLGLRDFIF